MTKIQLTISPNYVKDWGTVEAVREIFQNALDNETTNPENEMYFNYDSETQLLQIGNKTSILELDSLLLGTTTKSDDNKTIGQHGEGYKIALMVLLREGKKVTVYNYGKREIWTTKLIKSRKFNNALITEVNVQKQAVFKSVPNHDLIFSMEGVTKEDYEAIVTSNLHLKKKENDQALKILTVTKFLAYTKGLQVLLNEEEAGNLYVNGLLIQQNSQFKYGYNFKPQSIELDRDRKLMDTLNTAFLTSSIWTDLLNEYTEKAFRKDATVEDKETYKEIKEILTELLLQNEIAFKEKMSKENNKELEEVEEYRDAVYLDPEDIKTPKQNQEEQEEQEAEEEDEDFESITTLSEDLYQKVVETHGINSVPVSSQADLEIVKKNVADAKPVIVSDRLYNMVKENVQVDPMEYKGVHERLVDWFEDVRYRLNDTQVQEFEAILKDIEN